MERSQGNGSSAKAQGKGQSVIYKTASLGPSISYVAALEVLPRKKRLAVLLAGIFG